MTKSNKPTNKRKKFVIIDGNAYLNIAYYGFKEDVLDENNEDQKMLHGFLYFLEQIKEDMGEFAHLVVVFDYNNQKEKDYRKLLFSDYKANRPAKTEDMRRQQKVTIDVVKALGEVVISYPRYEADDAIASIAASMQEQYDVYIYSNDKDLAQLVTHNTFLVRRIKKDGKAVFVTYNEDKVVEIFGVKPNKIADLLALAGDTADNLPGLEKIGYKKAAKIIEKYSNVEAFIEMAQNGDKQAQEILKDKAEQLLLVKKLATINNDLPISIIAREAFKQAIKIKRSKNHKHNIEELRAKYDL